MKTGFLFLVSILCLTFSSLAQKSDQKPNSPKEKSTVKREYDDKGNLIRFDSTYTYSYSGDTTLTKSILPKEFQEFFRKQMGTKADSSLFGNSFFDGFDQFFSNSFGSQTDSTFMKKFKMSPHFHGFMIDPDSIALSLKDFGGFFGTPNDSVLSKLPKTQNEKSMEDMMKMLRQHMQEMEKHHQEIFNDQKNWKKL